MIVNLAGRRVWGRQIQRVFEDTHTYFSANNSVVNSLHIKGFSQLLNVIGSFLGSFKKWEIQINVKEKKNETSKYVSLYYPISVIFILFFQFLISFVSYHFFLYRFPFYVRMIVDLLPNCTIKLN